MTQWYYLEITLHHLTEHQEKRKLVKDEYVLFDLGVIYNHYCSDMTRTVKIRTPSEEAQTIYNIVLEAETNAIEAIRAGVPLQDIDKIARDIISDADTVIISLTD